MIAFVSGILTNIIDNMIEVDTGGIAYEITLPVSDIEKLPSLRSEVKIYTHLNVREDEMSLFGFISRDEKELFRKLITVSGIGPKGALGILSAFTPADLRFAILSGDAKAISKAPGIGAKTAQRLLIELKDKISLEDGFKELSDTVDITGEVTDTSALGEAVMALTVLGYSNADALKAVKRSDPDGKSVEEILKDALKILGR